MLPPSILRNLPSDASKAQNQVIEILRKEFPPGTPESVVTMALKKQGFRVDKDEDSGRQFAIYGIFLETYVEPGGECRGTFLIDWNLTGDHLIKDFHASQSTQCGNLPRPPLP